MPKGGIYAIRLLTKNVVLFFNYIDKYLIHLQYEYWDQTNNRQTFAIVSWQHANAFFRDIEPVIFVLCAWLKHWEKIFSFVVFWSMSRFYYILFIFLLLLLLLWIGTTIFQLNGRRSTSFRHCRSEGEWKRRRTIVQVERMEYTRRILQLILK
jgi:hypothetical protein